MTLEEFMVAKGFARPGSNKCFCPMHADLSPSAILNKNSIYCFAESRLYSLWDFQQAFGIVLDKAEEAGSAQLAKVKGGSSYSFNEVLFTFPFEGADIG